MKHSYSIYWDNAWGTGYYQREHLPDWQTVNLALVQTSAKLESQQSLMSDYAHSLDNILWLTLLFEIRAQCHLKHLSHVHDNRLTSNVIPIN